MSSSRDDFGIAFRSALLKKGGARRFSLIVFILISIIIFFLDTYNYSFMKQARTIINDGVYRLSLVASTPLKVFPSLSDKASSFMNIKSENKKLKNELESYKRKELNVEFLLNQNKNLKQLIETDSIFSGIYDTGLASNVIVAKVLLDKSSPYLQSIIINKGFKSGVLKGMPVLNKDFLVGRVVETNYMSSRVLLLSDLNSRIPVTLGENDTQAILKGNGGSKPLLEYLPEEYKLIEGTNIFTSGKDQIFKPGTPIGTTNNNGEVVLFVEPNQLSFIKIILDQQRKESF
jgi:rod shape-determining protein MreC